MSKYFPRLGWPFALVTLLLTLWLPDARAGSILREVYTGIGGSSLSDLKQSEFPE